MCVPRRRTAVVLAPMMYLHPFFSTPFVRRLTHTTAIATHPSHNHNTRNHTSFFGSDSSLFSPGPSKATPLELVTRPLPSPNVWLSCVPPRSISPRPHLIADSPHSFRLSFCVCAGQADKKGVVVVCALTAARSFIIIARKQRPEKTQYTQIACTPTTTTSLAVVEARAHAAQLAVHLARRRAEDQGAQRVARDADVLE